jgi:hypothetical protein
LIAVATLIMGEWPHWHKALVKSALNFKVC